VTTPDAYRGWIEASATRRLKFREPRYASKGRIALVTSNVAIIYLEPFSEPRERITVTVDTRLELLSEQSHRFKVRLPDGRLGWVRKEDVTVRTADFSYPATTRKKTVEVGKRFLGVPYLWGGTTPLGFDCSGLVQLVCKMNGINLPRDADMQFMVGKPIEIKDLQPADLVFFSNANSGITHVGMFVGDGEFIHASGKANGVTITSLSDPYYQSILVGARRVWKNHADY
jgi:cell wall-associated NlpC family hydrolase